MKSPRDDPPPYSTPPQSPPPQETAPLLPAPSQHRRNAQPRHRKKRSALALVLKFAIWSSIFLILGRWFYRTGFPAIPIAQPIVQPIVRVAVVGAGPAGVSTAYTLANQMKGSDVRVEIVLFEEKGAVGGRMVLGYDEEMEQVGRRIRAEEVASGLLGATVLRERAMAALGVEYGKIERDRATRDVGFFDGRSFVSKAMRPSAEIGWGMWLALVWRYGASVWRARDLPKGTMSDFMRLLKGRNIFETVGKMVENVEIKESVGMGAKERLWLKRIGGKYVDEVLEPQLLRQTGQSVEELSDLTLSIALEKEDNVSGGIGGSFESILTKFVERSRAHMQVHTKVTDLKRRQVAAGKEVWIIELEKSGDHQPTYESFDKIILAGPWNTSSLREDQSHDEDAVYYRPLWVTCLVSSGKLKGEYFGSSGELPTQILPIQSANLPSELEGVHEISYVADVFGPDVTPQSVRKLYRILSDHSIPKETISTFVEDGMLESFEEKIESAYPLLWPRKGSFGSFKIQEGLWHTGVIEGIGSSVDLSWVAGENAAKLVAREIRNRRS